jgi:hypothetical protein
MTTPRDSWTEAHFDEMSWHDNHVHGLRVVEGEHGAGELVLDLDYILEWLCGDSGVCQFNIVPAELRFKDGTSLRVHIDYGVVSAAIGPFSIHAIERREEVRERYTAVCWTIALNWPRGEITFEAPGFEQRPWGKVVSSSEQVLQPQERVRA